MIQITSIEEFTFTTLERITPPECANVLHLKRLLTTPNQTLECWVVLLNEKVIGYGSIAPSPKQPLTAGVGSIPHHFIILSERRRGYGNQLFQHLLQTARRRFGLLALSSNCPWYTSRGPMLDLQEI